MSIFARNQRPYGSPELVTTFGVLQAFGFVGSTLMLATALISTSVRRHTTWLSFCIAWIISSFSYLLLFFGGVQNKPTLNARNPICMTQASLIYSAPVLVAGTLFALVAQLWHTVRYGNAQSKEISRAVLFITPYVAFLLINVILLSIASVHPSLVSIKNGIYCGFTNGIPGDVSATIVMITMFFTLFYEAKIARMLLPKIKQGGSQPLPEQFPLPMVVRVLIFNIFSVLSIISGAFFLTQEQAALDVANLILALTPTAFVLTFGSQTDILRAWMFWDRKPVPPPKDTLPRTSVDKIQV